MRKECWSKLLNTSKPDIHRREQAKCTPGRRLLEEEAGYPREGEMVEKGIDQTRKVKSSNEPIALLLVDQQMPHMTGGEPI